VNGHDGETEHVRRTAAPLLALLAASTLVLLPAHTAAAPDPHLARLDDHALMGRWSCTGGDDRGAALSASLDWGFNDAGDFYFSATPRPATPPHPVIAETWSWDAVGKVWRAVPDDGGAEQVQFTTGGWQGDTLTWVRMAAESRLDRAFVRTGPDQLTFRSERALPSTGDGPVRRHVFYTLACRRTVNDAPR
jgi:hypothetical protein